MNKKYYLSLFGFILIILLAKLFILFSASSTYLTDDDYREAARRYYKNFSVYIPEKVIFANEEIPIDKYYVREALDKELLVNTYWHSHTFLLFKRAYRWFPIIEPILKEQGIPDDFKYLAVIESELSNVVSPAGASGFWQFMKSTAISFDLEINSELDERYNIEKSTLAACKYLKQSYLSYNNWCLAAASYNTGMENLNKAIKQQDIDNYFDLLLNNETSRYVYRIIAIKLIFENPTEYGFYLRKKDLYPPIPTKTIKIDTTINDIAQFAKQYDYNYKILKDFNPWLRGNTLTNKDNKTYYIKLPAKGAIYYKYLQKDIINDNRLFNDSISIDKI